MIIGTKITEQEADKLIDEGIAAFFDCNAFLYRIRLPTFIWRSRNRLLMGYNEKGLGAL